MKKAMMTTFILMTTSLSFAQTTTSSELVKGLARKTIAGYQKILDSEELKNCQSQGEFKRLFTNSCTEFLQLTESALDQMEVSLKRHAQPTKRAAKTISMEHIDGVLQDMSVSAQRAKIMVMALSARLANNIALAAEAESLETGDAKEQVDFVVQTLKENIQEIKETHLK